MVSIYYFSQIYFINILVVGGTFTLSRRVSGYSLRDDLTILRATEDLRFSEGAVRKLFFKILNATAVSY